MKSLSTIVVQLYLALFLPIVGFSQYTVSGRVISDDDSTPVAYASVGIKNKEAGCVADASGKFTLVVPSFVKLTDSLIISSIGYERSGFMVAKVKSLKEFRLKNDNKSLNNVIIKSRFRELRLGNAKDESFQFFRAWGSKGTGGEIGQIMDVPQNSFTVENVQIKIDNKNDTCWVRLHIRDVVEGIPTRELLKENIIKQVYGTTSSDSIEFDLGENTIEVSDKKIFVGFEVLDCRSKDQLPHSICFVGDQYGQHIYKPFTASKWDWDAMFSIHIKMFMKY